MLLCQPFGCLLVVVRISVDEVLICHVAHEFDVEYSRRFWFWLRLGLRLGGGRLIAADDEGLDFVAVTVPANHLGIGQRPVSIRRFRPNAVMDEFEFYVASGQIVDELVRRHDLPKSIATC